MSISFASVSVEIPRLVRATLAADVDLAAYFEQITLADLYQLDGPIRTPALFVVPGTLAQERQVGGEAEGRTPSPLSRSSRSRHRSVTTSRRLSRRQRRLLRAAR